MVESTPEVTLGTLHNDLGALREDVTGLREDVTGLREDVTGLRGDVTGLRGDVTGLRGDIGGLKDEMRAGFADLKATMIAGFSRMTTREQTEEMLRLLREMNRSQEAQFADLHGYLRAQQLENQALLRQLVEGQIQLVAENRSVSSEVRALVVRIDAIIRGRNNGAPGA
jgi:hypothetical protein